MSGPDHHARAMTPVGGRLVPFTGVLGLSDGWSIEYEDGIPVRMGWTPPDTDDAPGTPVP